MQNFSRNGWSLWHIQIRSLRFRINFCFNKSIMIFFTMNFTTMTVKLSFWHILCLKNYMIERTSNAANVLIFLNLILTYYYIPEQYSTTLISLLSLIGKTTHRSCIYLWFQNKGVLNCNKKLVSACFMYNIWPLMIGHIFTNI